MNFFPRAQFDQLSVVKLVKMQGPEGKKSVLFYSPLKMEPGRSFVNSILSDVANGRLGK